MGREQDLAEVTAFLRGLYPSEDFQVDIVMAESDGDEGNTQNLGDSQNLKTPEALTSSGADKPPAKPAPPRSRQRRRRPLAIAECDESSTTGSDLAHDAHGRLKTKFQRTLDLSADSREGLLDLATARKAAFLSRGLRTRSGHQLFEPVQEADPTPHVHPGDTGRAAALEIPGRGAGILPPPATPAAEAEAEAEAWRAVERAEKLVGVPVVHLGAAAARTSAAASTPRVSQTVQAARDHFDEIFSEFNTTLESEYDDVFEPPPPDAYLEKNRVHEIHPRDKLAWFYGSGGANAETGDPPDDLGGAEFGRGPRGSKAVGFFQDARIQGRKHVPGHTLGEESTSAPWRHRTPTSVQQALLQPRSAGDLVESEAHASFHGPPADWKPPALARVPPESIRAGNTLFSSRTAPAPPPPAPVDLARMRSAFEEEMSRIHNIDDASPPVSEYDARFTAPALRVPSGADGLEASLLLGPAAPTEHQLAFRPFAQDDLAAIRQQMPAGATSMRPGSARVTSSWGRTAAKEDPMSTEYASSFADLEKRRAATAAAREEKLAKEAKRASETAKMAAAFAAKAAAKAATKLQVSTAADTASSTEYRDRFCHGGDTSVLPDPGFLPSPRKQKPVKLDEPMLSEYDHEYDHLGKPKPPAERPPPHTYTPGFITEYEGAICGYDLRQDVKSINQELQDIERKSALKPAYALKPEHKHKHRLIDAEAARGYVPKTEHMQSFVDPRAKYHQFSDQFKATAQLDDAKLGPKEISVNKAAHTEKVARELGIKGIPERPRPSHEDIIEATSKQSLKWWNEEGRRLWATYNPVSLYPRWNPFGDRFKTPETEYQRAFRKSAMAAAAANNTAARSTTAPAEAPTPIVPPVAEGAM
ncbi:Hypothetical Protein FCC1311_059952 [Hondaea fermentalgiana]|uniref:Uncharacterized protein n=1 Tax=Hondaea fermentalgiana TaxID=2315210 RepID=A0A2R5GPH3_9STRA|nr:Hypothetical Protein FCC1311_059952 [Hondaea fermentalgiana]|eukprot:GBG29774.1 Hypothetical Protein FCC1311_059952 [Hondaea fermentalgiana]